MVKDKKYVESDYWGFGAIIFEYLLDIKPYADLDNLKIID